MIKSDVISFKRFDFFKFDFCSLQEIIPKIKYLFFSIEEHLHPSDDVPILPKHDITYITGSVKPLGADYYERPTILVELKPNIEDTFKQFSATSQNEIRQIITSNSCTFEMHSNLTESELKRFKTLFNEFARTIGMNTFDIDYLLALNNSGALYISEIKNADNQVLIFHVYRVSKSRPELLHSYRNIFIDQKQYISKANRYCHWLDICYFANDGYTIYDLGGFYQGSDEKHLNINKFKLSFGGNVVVLYNSILYNSFKAKTFRAIKNIRKV